MTTLLLADDSVTIQRVIELTFADEGVRVIAVGDGETAIKRIDDEHPDIVLADVGMPGVDGYQVARHVKQSPASAGVPVLLLTGAFEPIDEERARDTGCDGVLVKPFEPLQLIKTVKELLAGTRSAELWPADMPRLDSAVSRPGATPPAAAPPVLSEPVPPAASPEDLLADDGAHLLSIPYEPEADPDLAAALARLEFVAVPEPSDAPAPARAPSLEWDLSAAPAAGGGARQVAAPGNQSLANVFSALLAAERQNPDARATISASPALSEAAVEEVVQKVVRRMTDELVRKIVLETAERLIREEIDRIKA
jgi:CheY-like chemotaxis protein